MTENYDFKIELTRGKIIHSLSNGHRVKNAKRLTIMSFIITFFYILVSTQSASADPLDLVEFDSPSYTLGDDVFFAVSESTAANACSETGTVTPGVITVTLTTTRPGVGVIDTITMNAIEINDPAIRTPTPETCIFGNVELHVMADDQTFNVGDTIVVKQIETSGGENTDNTITTKPVTFSSSSTPGGILVTLTETGENTGIFTKNILLTSDSSIANTQLHVEPGDIIKANYLSKLSYGQINPSPDNDVGVLIAKSDDTITVSYNGFSDDATVAPGGGPGGGGGGLIRPGLLALDVIVPFGGGGGTSRDRQPPSFSSKFSFVNLIPNELFDFIMKADPFIPLSPVGDEISAPLTFNNKRFVLLGYSTTIQTQLIKTGEPVEFALDLSDQTGIEHLAIYMNLRGNNREIQHSDTYIIYDEKTGLQIHDPNGFFLDVKFEEKEYDDNKYDYNFNITFARSMQKSDIIIRTWDQLLNSADTKIFDAIEVTGDDLTQEPVQQTTATITLPYFKEPIYLIPNADEQGNLLYYNAFGQIEKKKTHPYHLPFVYPSFVGQSERYSEEFQIDMINEKIRAEKIVHTLIVDPFVTQEERDFHYTFVYPSHIGKLDRENIELTTSQMNAEEKKAFVICEKKFSTNHIQD